MINFIEIDYDAKQQALLAELRGLGAVLDTIIWQLPAPANDLYTTCQEAARAAVALLARQWDNELAHLPPEVPRFRIEPVPGAEPVGRPVTLAEMLGTDYELTAQASQLLRYANPAGMSVIRQLGSGLAHALLDPPYGLRIDYKGAAHAAGYNQKRHDLLQRYLAAIPHVTSAADAEVLTCWEWSTDWSTYFEAGHEWWGAYCWTIADPGRGTIAVLLAASTD